MSRNNRITIAIDLGVPQEPRKCPKLSIEDKVKSALELIDSGHESAVEWRMINRLYRDLCKLKKNPRVENLKQMIEPVLAKFGFHKVTAGEH